MNVRLSLRMAVLLSVLLPAEGLHSQSTRTVQACTPGALGNCARIRWSATTHASSGLTTLDIAIANLGSLAMPYLATSMYNFVFWTGLPADVVFVDALVAPRSVGGASLVDTSDWSLFTSGDAIFLSALSNNGVGNCVAGVPQGGYGQAGRTCGGSQFLSFSFASPFAFDVANFDIANMEVVGLDPSLPADSCGDPAIPCVVTDVPALVTPEPSTLALFAPGVLLLGMSVRRSLARRRGLA